MFRDFHAGKFVCIVIIERRAAAEDGSLTSSSNGHTTKIKNSVLSDADRFYMWWWWSWWLGYTGEGTFVYSTTTSSHMNSLKLVCGLKNSFSFVGEHIGCSSLLIVYLLSL